MGAFVPRLGSKIKKARCEVKAVKKMEIHKIGVVLLLLPLSQSTRKTVVRLLSLVLTNFFLRAGLRPHGLLSTRRVATRVATRGPVRPAGPLMALEKVEIIPEVSAASEPIPVGGRNLYLFEDDPSARVCYDMFIGASAPNVMFLPYLLTPKNQGLSASLEAWCRREGHTYVCADYYGVSRSGGTTIDGTISRWTADTISLLERVVEGKTVLVGAAVGAWVAFRVAQLRPDLVAGLVGVSCDPDFTEELLWANLGEEDKDKIMAEGSHDITWGNTVYSISRNLIEDARNNLILQVNRTPPFSTHSLTSPSAFHEFRMDQGPWPSTVPCVSSMVVRTRRFLTPLPCA